MKARGWILIGCAVSLIGGMQVSAQQQKENRQADQPLKKRVAFNPRNTNDPMLSPDDILLLRSREQQRLAALEAERKRKEAEERRRQEEAERRRQFELALLRDPSMLIRDKIRVSGIIDKEVLIGNRLYPIGSTYMGAKIVAVGADSVTFLYKGHKFVRKVQI